MTETRRFSPGDVFTVPIDEGRVCCGQILASDGSTLCFGIFEGVYDSDDPPAAEQVTEQHCVLLAWSLDALLWHGRWRVIGSADVADVPLPAYKVAVRHPEDLQVVDPAGGRSRPASSREAERLPFQKVVAPIRMERAAAALQGDGEWDDEAYGPLLPPDHALTVNALFRE